MISSKVFKYSIATILVAAFLRSIFKSPVVVMSHPYAKELAVATLAVKRASILTKKLSDSIAETSRSGTQIKDDKSPVTVGDYASQAIINNAIRLNFPADKIVGEEDSDSLQDGTEEAAQLTARVMEIIMDVQQETAASEELLGSLSTKEEVFEAIDLGNYGGGSTGRFWALDPIDGTKGFLRGDQFAVCLALIEDGKVVLGVIGCPNLAENIVSNEEQTGVKGGLFSAVKGLGAYYTPLFGTDQFVPLDMQERISMTGATLPSELRVVEGVEKGHSSHSTQSLIKGKLQFDPATVASQTVNLDSQAKYCVLAKGQADIYLRLPINDKYREKIWDHAAGNILLYESGGQVGDIHGTPLDFGNGRLLNSQGVIAANKNVFERVISAVEEVLLQEKK